MSEVGISGAPSAVTALATMGLDRLGCRWQDEFTSSASLHLGLILPSR